MKVLRRLSDGDLCLRYLPVVIVLLDLVDYGTWASTAEVERHLEMGKKLLAAGQLSDALSHYHSAIDGDPTNYLTFFRRATVYLAMGKSKAALPDLDQCLKLHPEFTAARTNRGSVLLKLGNLNDALRDYEAVAKVSPDNGEAKNKLALIPLLKEHLKHAELLIDNDDYFSAIHLLTKLVESCPWSPKFHQKRAECYLEVGDLRSAINDLRPTTKLIPDNTDGYFTISQLYYRLGDVEPSLENIRECLKLDPDHKECYPFYKKVKKLNKQLQAVQEYIEQKRFEDAISKLGAALKTENQEEKIVTLIKHKKCQAHYKGVGGAESVEICAEVAEEDPENFEALMDLAEAYITNEQFEEAVAEYQKVESEENLPEEYKRRANEGLKRAQKLLKQSKKRDYYKILGVKRTARKKEIIKAYRKLAQKWHPDQYETEEDKARAQEKFMDIAAAKEVLTDPEMRRKFDSGEDPLDAEEQAHGGHGFNPFQQGFNPFGHGGGNFHFRYRHN